MGPKKEIIDPDEGDAWRTNIETRPLDDEFWSVKVVIIEGAGSDQDRLYLGKFEQYATEEKRFVIKNICKTETIFMVNQLGSEKKVRDSNNRVFEEAQNYLKEKKDIPADVLALIIKHLILQMKDEYLYIMRQKDEVKEGLKLESSTMVGKADVKGSVSAGRPAMGLPSTGRSKMQLRRSSSRGSGVHTDEDKKYNTQLRVRGEDWRDRVYVDDYPVAGPNIYVAVTGFLDPQLPGCLVKIGVPLKSVVQVRIDPGLTDVPSSLTRTARRGQSQTEILGEIAAKFWEDLQELRVAKETTADLRHTAFIVFTPPYWNSETLTGNPEKIYDDLCFLMYDVQDLSRQHEHYLDNMDIISIPVESEDERLTKYYLSLIQDLPLECYNVYSVMDSILHTVSKRHAIEEKGSLSSGSNSKVTSDNTKSTHGDKKVEKAHNLVSKVFETFIKSEEDANTYRITYGEEAENFKDPIVIDYGDLVKYNTFHVGNINLDNIVYRSLRHMPINKLWNNQERLSDKLSAKVNFHLNVLHSCFERDGIEPEEMDRMIHILACRKLFNNRSSLQRRLRPNSTIAEFKNIYLKRSVLAKPLTKCKSLVKAQDSTSVSRSNSFPSIRKSNSNSTLDEDGEEEYKTISFLFDLPDLSGLVSAAEIANGNPMKHLIDDFLYFEDFEGSRAFQILLDSFNKFNCIDYKFCEVTDCLILMFFNSHDKYGISREEWRSHIPTPLSLQDFFDYVLEENLEWIQNEEKNYDDTLLTKTFQSENKDLIDPHAATSCINETDVAADLLIEGSLKHADKLAEEESTAEGVLSPSKKSGYSSSSKISKKGKPPIPSPPKEVVHSFVAQDESVESVQIIKKPFWGYDLGDRRVEVFGKDCTFFSKDGTVVRSAYYLIIPTNIEYSCITITPGSGDSSFYIHKVLGDDVPPEHTDVAQSFRIRFKDNMALNIKQQKYQIPAAVQPASVEALHKNSSKKNDISEKDLLNISETLYDTIPFYSFCITWPNGLVIESVHQENSSKISHIRLTYLTPMTNIDEDCRCITMEGEVIIFKKSGDIHVLKCDGTFITITNYAKSPVYPEVTPQTDVSTDKDKNKNKAKSPPKGKEKASSKIRAIDDERQEEPLYYELIIDDFEAMEPNGMKQRYIKNQTLDLGKLLVRTATDYQLGEVFSKRMDGTTILLNKDGILVVSYPNGTRIVTSYVVEQYEVYPEWTDEELEYLEMFKDEPDPLMPNNSENSVSQHSVNDGRPSNASGRVSFENIEEGEENETKPHERTDGYVFISLIYSIEHKHFATVTINKSEDKVIVDSPNTSSVIVDSNIHYVIKLDDTTTARFDNEQLHIEYEACVKCRSFTECDVQMRFPADEEVGSTVSDKPVKKTWLSMKDSFCKRIIIDEEGGMEEDHEDKHMGDCADEEARTEDKPEEYFGDNTMDDGKSVHSTSTNISRCRQLSEARRMKFFILRRDLRCTELVHRLMIEEYKQECRWQPWCSINSLDSFGDHRRTVCILLPINLTETELWLMESKLADKPKYLTYKDLKKDPGKGFYHWMRPYERFEPRPIKPENVLPTRQPRAFVLRDLEQHCPDTEMNPLRGAKELCSAILRYRRVMESDSETILHVPIVDTRTTRDKCVYDLVQHLAAKIFEDLYGYLESDVLSRARADITTAPPPPPPSPPTAQWGAEECPMECAQSVCEEEEVGSPGASTSEQQLQAVDLTPEATRYWRRREAEYEQEMFYKQLLREGTVPPYFKNILGGAIWWEVNNVATDAARTSERRKMRCACTDEETRPGDDGEPMLQT